MKHYKVDFDEKESVFGPGDGIFIPSGEKHKHKGKVLEDVVKLILVEDQCRKGNS